MDKKSAPESPRFERATDLLKAMSNAYRLRILCNLSSGEKSVSELESLVGLRQTTLSQHLARLRYVGLVSTRRDAQCIYYSIAESEGKQLLAAINDLYCGDTGTCETVA